MLLRHERLEYECVDNWFIQTQRICHDTHVFSIYKNIWFYRPITTWGANISLSIFKPCIRFLKKMNRMFWCTWSIWHTVHAHVQPQRGRFRADLQGATNSVEFGKTGCFPWFLEVWDMYLGEKRITNLWNHWNWSYLVPTLQNWTYMF